MARFGPPVKLPRSAVVTSRLMPRQLWMPHRFSLAACSDLAAHGAIGSWPCWWVTGEQGLFSRGILGVGKDMMAASLSSFLISTH